ncbi:MAG: ATP-binding protein [Syntrophales bacterium]
MTFRSNSITRTSSVLTAIVSLIVAVSIPAAYFAITYQHMEGSVNAEIALSARAIEGLVNNNPLSWQFEELRLQEILERRLAHDNRDKRIIRDMQGQIIAQTSEPVPNPSLTFSQPIYDSGAQVGRVDIYRSISTLIARTAIIGAGSVLSGIMIFLLFRTFPLRAVQRAYHDLEENEQRLTLALKSGVFGVWDLDIKKNVMVWDDKTYEIYGVSRDSVHVVMEAWQNAIHREDRDRVLKGVRTGVLEEKCYNTEFRIVHPDGKVRHIKADGIAIRDMDGKPSRMIGLNHDITDRKQTEADKEILESQNLQLQKAESLGRMAGAIAHHFNNQLGVVIGNLELAIGVLPRSAEPVNILNASMQAAWKAAEMNSLMLTYLGQSLDRREPLDLSGTCLRNLPILQDVITGEVSLETDLPSSGPIITANANEIQQVISNLTTNAWEAIGKNRGVIHLSIKTVSPAEIPAVHRFPINWQPQAPAYACLEVTDTGSGIAADDLDKLFDPFFSSKFTGRGLGLPVVLGIVKAYAGVVTVESEPGRGSIFRIFLPVAAEKAVPRQPDKESYAPEMERGGTVLLVDDEEMLRATAAAMLKGLDFSVLEAKDGIEAIEVFRQHRDEIRCVICDLTMPRMNGWETLTALRKLAPDFPVILASGYDKAHVMSGDHPELPQVFLGKPYRLKGLNDAICEALAGKKK